MNPLVFLVDDNQEIIELQTLALNAEGFDVLSAGSGPLALGMLRDMPRPQLVLLDVDLGDMSGPEFLEIADKKYPQFASEVPVVFMTACLPPPNTRAIGAIDKLADLDSYLTSVHAFLRSGEKGKKNAASHYSY